MPLRTSENAFHENQWPSYCQFAIEKEVIQVDCIPILEDDYNIYKGISFYNITRGKHEDLSVQTTAELSFEDIFIKDSNFQYMSLKNWRWGYSPPGSPMAT